MTKAVIYARISRDVGQDSLMTQEQQCRSYAEKTDLEVVGVYTDVGSGSDPNRPNLWEAIWAMEPGMVLLAARLDRISRSVYLSAHVEDRLTRAGCRIISASGEGTWADSDSAEDTLVRQILFAMAEYERKIIAARCSAAQIAFMRTGRIRNSSPPFGYIESEDHRMVVEPDAMATIRAIARMVRQQDKTARACQWWLNEHSKYPRRPAYRAVRRIRTTLVRDDYVYWIMDLREDSQLPLEDWSGPMSQEDIGRLLIEV